MYTINRWFKKLQLEERGTAAAPGTTDGMAYGVATHYITLYSLVRAFRPLVVVEIGTRAGCSSAYIAQALKDHASLGNASGHLWTFDNWAEGEYSVKKDWEAAGLVDWITLTVGDSKETIPEVFEEMGPHIQFAFIDGDHFLPGVQIDVDNVVKYAEPEDCVVVCHDINRPDDCYKAFESLKEKGFEQTFIIPAWGGLGVARKTEKQLWDC